MGSHHEHSAPLVNSLVRRAVSKSSDWHLGQDCTATPTFSSEPSSLSANPVGNQLVRDLVAPPIGGRFCRCAAKGRLAAK